jgi:hypothetical protein
MARLKPKTMPYIPIPPPIRKRDTKESMGELTDEKREYLKELGEWIGGYPDGKEWIFPNGIMRDKVFFRDLIDKVGIIGSYSGVDRVWLDLITRAHWKSKRDDKLIP